MINTKIILKAKMRYCRSLQEVTYTQGCMKEIWSQRPQFEDNQSQKICARVYLIYCIYDRYLTISNRLVQFARILNIDRLVQITGILHDVLVLSTSNSKTISQTHQNRLKRRAQRHHVHLVV